MKAAACKQAGFSLVEVMIATAILAILFSAVLGTMTMGMQTFNSASALVDIQNQARRTIDDIARAIQPAGLSTISPIPPATGTPGTHTITFLPCTGYSIGTDPPEQWGNLSTIAFAYERGEANDGVDNNSNNLIDEGIVTLTVAGSGNKTLGHWVKEDGISFNLDGTLLTITLEMHKRGAKGLMMETSLSTSVQIKND